MALAETALMGGDRSPNRRCAIYSKERYAKQEVKFRLTIYGQWRKCKEGLHRASPVLLVHQAPQRPRPSDGCSRVRWPSLAQDSCLQSHDIMLIENAHFLLSFLGVHFSFLYAKQTETLCKYHCWISISQKVFCCISAESTLHFLRLSTVTPHMGTLED